MDTYLRTVLLAQRLYNDSRPSEEDEGLSGLNWDELSPAQRDPFRAQAEQIMREREMEEAAAKAVRIKEERIDAYRARVQDLPITPPLDPRVSGFIDGWDAAMEYIYKTEAGK